GPSHDRSRLPLLGYHPIFLVVAWQRRDRSDANFQLSIHATDTRSNFAPCCCAKLAVLQRPCSLMLLLFDRISSMSVIQNTSRPRTDSDVVKLLCLGAL